MIRDSRQLVRDFDFHPDEDTIRCFTIPDSGVLVDEDKRWVCQTWDPTDTHGTDVVLRHHSFADEWFKLNATFNLAGELIHTGDEGFAVNCDVATPMVRRGSNAGAIDLFLDVLVRRDWTYNIIDVDEFDGAAAAGLVPSDVARSAQAGLARLVHWIDSGRLQEEIMRFEPEVAGRAPAELPFSRVAVDASPFPEWASFCTPGADPPAIQPPKSP